MVGDESTVYEHSSNYESKQLHIMKIRNFIWKIILNADNRAAFPSPKTSTGSWRLSIFETAFPFWIVGLLSRIKSRRLIELIFGYRTLAGPTRGRLILKRPKTADGSVLNTPGAKIPTLTSPEAFGSETWMCDLIFEILFEHFSIFGQLKINQCEL